MVANRQPATFKEKAGAILYLCGLPGYAVTTVAKRVMGTSKRKGSLMCAVRNEIAYRVASRLDIRQIRFVMGNKTAAQRIHGCKQAKLLNGCGRRYPSENFTATWLVEAEDRTPNDPILLYFHGGGYVLPIDGAQVSFLCDIYHQTQNPRLSILILDYSLAPEMQYPQQLCEAALLYKSLVDTEGCSNIMLIGDSAGGNLAIELLAHIHHHHPDAVQIDAPILPHAAVIMSPWVNLYPPCSGSYDELDGMDIVDQKLLADWAAKFCCSDEERRTSPWVSPLVANSSYWEKVLPENTLVIWGSDEVMKDECTQWAKQANIKNILEEPDAFHIASIFDRLPKTMCKISSVIAQGCSGC